MLRPPNDGAAKLTEIEKITLLWDNGSSATANNRLLFDSSRKTLYSGTAFHAEVVFFETARAMTPWTKFYCPGQGDGDPTHKRKRGGSMIGPGACACQRVDANICGGARAGWKGRSP